MTQNKLPKTYEFKDTERRIYQMWEEADFFKPSNDPNSPNFNPTIPPYVISIPPPNVTGELHLGHAMFVSMEDLMIRYHRMKGIPTLWVPGTDHAGIATQLQVEKALEKDGKSREQIGREAFLKRTWEWKKTFGGIITQQIRRLGASCDWSRERFTLDEGLSLAVREAFVSLYEKGLIYRGPRLINWSPGLKTAVSDLEVEYFEEPGTLYYFKYILVPEDQRENPQEYIPVATTRPETILGDTAVAVHPDDDRFKHFVGREAIVPILQRRIPVIADEYVDREFGTGALKITPGHDPNDFEIGERHGLEVISVLNESAMINENGGPYANLDRFKGRKRLWQDMLDAGLVIKEEPYTMKVPRSQRGGEIIEPMVSTQWFVETKPLADAALKVVQEGHIKIIPERFTKVYYNWLENIQDWCISRQLWWGHRIPVWYCDDCEEVIVARVDPDGCPNCTSGNIRQETDVLDTWFSSGLWPFSTLGWPKDKPDLRYFYPTTMMETGYDILFFWVARMIMMGLEFTGEVPFKEVYLHGLIRDAHGRKMSKTAGNVIDPLEVMDEFGTDALRFTLLVGSTPGNDMNLSINKVEANRNFANKIWNATRFVLGNLDKVPPAPAKEPDWSLADSWIWARLQNLIRDVERLFQKHQYGEAGRQIYDFFWSEFADWYIEIAKLQIEDGGDNAFYTLDTLVRVLDLSFRLLHPYTPFVTEELWQHLKRGVQDSPLAELHADWQQALMIASWPEPRDEEEGEQGNVSDFTLVMEVVREIRNLRSEKNVQHNRYIPAIFVSDAHKQILFEQSKTIASLARLNHDQLKFLETLAEKPDGHIALVVSSIEIYLPLSELVDPDEEQARLEKELVEVEKQVRRLKELLTGPFSEKAPADVVQKEHEKLNSYLEMAEKLRSQLETFS